MMEQIYRTPGAPSDAEQLDTARKLVIEHRRASISLVQRHMRIGYNAAARLMEELEREGTVRVERPVRPLVEKREDDDA
jgi:hypothetical protein